ncbi:MAG: FMN-binding negative transcriptional regulator [Methylococcales bacterium]
MYIPDHFDEPDIKVMQALMREHPLATLVTLSSAGLNANHIPLHLESDGSEFGVLRGHVARANPLWRDFGKDHDMLAIFQAGNAYISPSWYASKAETGKVVPTWNYAVVHAYGAMRIIDDAQWLLKQLQALTEHNEADFPEPWAVADAPAEFTEKLLQNIVGIEIAVTRLTGKWKVSQNQPIGNQRSVVSGLKAAGQTDMADLVEAKIKPEQ